MGSYRKPFSPLLPRHSFPIITTFSNIFNCNWSSFADQISVQDLQTKIFQRWGLVFTLILHANGMSVGI